MTMLAVPRVIEVVRALSWPRYTQGSKSCPASPKSGSSSGTSRTHTEAKPARSACWIRSMCPARDGTGPSNPSRGVMAPTVILPPGYALANVHGCAG